MIEDLGMEDIVLKGYLEYCHLVEQQYYIGWLKDLRNIL